MGTDTKTDGLKSELDKAATEIIRLRVALDEIRRVAFRHPYDGQTGEIQDIALKALLEEK